MMFNFLFVENSYFFVLLKYLFPVAEIKYLILKKYFFQNIKLTHVSGVLF
jgi:hypothetical protein